MLPIVKIRTRVHGDQVSDKVLACRARLVPQRLDEAPPVLRSHDGVGRRVGAEEARQGCGELEGLGGAETPVEDPVGGSVVGSVDWLWGS